MRKVNWEYAANKTGEGFVILVVLALVLWALRTMMTWMW
jgi:hypothetical protein